MKKVPVSSRQKPIVQGVPPVFAEKTISNSELFQTIAMPKFFGLEQKYFAIEILPPHLIDSETTYVIAGDSQALMAILMSSFFPIWVRAVSKKGQKKSNPNLDYNNFPFPEFTRKQGKLLEEAGERIHRARGGLKGSTLSEAYQQPHLPDHLAMAHQALDRLMCEIFELPVNATEEEISQKLFEKYLILFQNT
jgi:hypothetical protein